MMQSDWGWRLIALVSLALSVAIVAERVWRGYPQMQPPSHETIAATTRPVINETVDRPPASGTVASSAPPSAATAHDDYRASDLFKAAAPSVVAITAIRGSRMLDSDSGGSGSGFIWDTQGHIVTNNHVIDEAREINVVLDDGRSIPARVIGRAPWADLAVLKLSEVPSNLKPMPVGNSKDLLVGQTVYAIGNPFGLSRTLTTGIISALDRRLPTPTGRVVSGVIQTDAAINPGNSGGPLVDTSGRLIGVNTAIIAPSGTFAGVGFAIPADVVKRIVPSLISTGRAPLAGIGVTTLPEEIVARAGLKGVVVQGVRRGSSAEQAGLVGVEERGRLGDVITAIEGKPVTSVADMAIALEAVGIGKRATITIQHDGRSRDLEVLVQDIN